MTVDADGLAPRISSRTKIPSIRAREAAEVLVPAPPAAATSVKKKRTVYRGVGGTPTTGSTVTGFSAVSQSPKPETAERDWGDEGRREQAEIELKQRVEGPKEPEEVFCVCRGPDDGMRPMIQCDHCDEW